jgi:hypothetical protein
MFRKMLFVVCVITILSLMGSGQAFAKKDVLPTWETAFDPGPDMLGTYFVHSVEEFKGDLYTVAGSGWFGEDPVTAGRLFRSPDGKNWEPATDLGFGLGVTEDDCSPNYYDTSWDMIVFQEQLYLLPFDNCYLRPGVILRSSDGTNWETVVTAEELGKSWYDTWYGQFHKLAVFKGMLYANMDYYDPVTEFTASNIYRSPNGDPGTWEEVINFPGWGYPGTFHTFKGALYVASDGIYTPPDWEEAPEQIWRTFDGMNWEMVVGDGFGNPGTDGLGAFADYKGYLYVGAGTYEGNGGQIWRSKDGLHWDPVILDGFGNPLDEKIDGLVVYEGELYAYTVNWSQGCSVYRTKDAKSWERANEPGWGNSQFATSHHTADQVVFKDDLYMGVVGVDGVLLELVHPDK